MSVTELTVVEPRGRQAIPLQASYVEDITESDLVLLAGNRGTPAKPIQRLRDRHHALARALAQGMRDGEASLITGYDIARISVLRSDPSFKQLITEYKNIKDAAFADFQERAAVVTLEALNQIQEELEEDAERDEKEISIGQKMAIVEKLADRTGHAPVTRSVQVSATVDLTERLRLARQRVLEANTNGD